MVLDGSVDFIELKDQTKTRMKLNINRQHLIKRRDVRLMVESVVYEIREGSIWMRSTLGWYIVILISQMSFTRMFKKREVMDSHQLVFL